MDISSIVNDLIGKITKDDNLLKNFNKNSKATVKKLINVELPDSALDAVVDAVKAKVLTKNASDIVDKFSGMFAQK